MRIVPMNLLLVALSLLLVAAVPARMPTSEAETAAQRDSLEALKWRADRRGPEGRRGAYGPGQDAPGDRWGMSRMRALRRLTPEEEAMIIEFFRREGPDVLEVIGDLKDRHPMMHELMMSRLQRKGLDHLRRQLPDSLAFEQELRMIKLKIRSHALGADYRSTDDAEARKRIKAELAQVLNELFDVREQKKRDEVKHLTKRMDELRRVMESRKRNKATIVERRLQELTGARDDTRW